MPDLSFAWDSAGLVVPVVVGLPLASLSVLHQAGTATPAPVEVRGLIDSGSDVSVITPLLVQRFGLSPLVSRATSTTIGSQEVNLYTVSLVIVGPLSLGGPNLASPDHTVIGCHEALPENLDVIIGLDILRTLALVSDGPGQTFTLRF